MRKMIPAFLVLALMLIGCKNQNSKDSKDLGPDDENATGNPAEKLAEQIGKTHHAQKFRDEEALQFQISISYGGKKNMEAKISLMTDLGKIKVEKQDGTTLVFDGKNSAIYPKSDEYEGALTDLWMWARIFSLPYRLNAPETKWRTKSRDSIGQNEYDTAKIMLKRDKNGPQEDWFIAYADKGGHDLKAVALAPSDWEGMKNSQTVFYDDFSDVGDVIFAKRWELYKRDQKKGNFTKKTGEAEISDVKFFEPPEDYFDIPEDAKEIEQDGRELVL